MNSQFVCILNFIYILTYLTNSYILSLTSITCTPPQLVQFCMEPLVYNLGRFYCTTEIFVHIRLRAKFDPLGILLNQRRICLTCSSCSFVLETIEFNCLISPSNVEIRWIDDSSSFNVCMCISCQKCWVKNMKIKEMKKGRRKWFQKKILIQEKFTTVLNMSPVKKFVKFLNICIREGAFSPSMMPWSV